jgi:hypothetical protein
MIGGSMRERIGRFVAASAMLAAMLGVAKAETIASAYSDLDLAKCRHTAGTEPEDDGFWRCAGYGGIAVRVVSADQRMTVSFGPKAADMPASSQTFPSFNAVDKVKIEWRIAEKGTGKPAPFATIVRWTIQLPNDRKASSGRVLVVTRLGRAVCQVGYVDALVNKNANALARELADTRARSFDCTKDTPTIVGERGESVAGIAEQIRTDLDEKKRGEKPKGAPKP